MWSADIQTAIDVLVELHEDNRQLRAMAKVDGGNIGLRECQGRIATVARYLMKVRDMETT